MLSVVTLYGVARASEAERSRVQSSRRIDALGHVDGKFTSEQERAPTATLQVGKKMRALWGNTTRGLCEGFVHGRHDGIKITIMVQFYFWPLSILRILRNLTLHNVVFVPLNKLVK